MNMKDGRPQRESKESTGKSSLNLPMQRKGWFCVDSLVTLSTYTVTVPPQIPPDLMLPLADIHTAPYTAKLGVFLPLPCYLLPVRRGRVESNDVEDFLAIL